MPAFRWRIQRRKTAIYQRLRYAGATWGMGGVLAAVEGRSVFAKLPRLPESFVPSDFGALGRPVFFLGSRKSTWQTRQREYKKNNCSCWKERYKRTQNLISKWLITKAMTALRENDFGSWKKLIPKQKNKASITHDTPGNAQATDADMTRIRVQT